jgi:molecular chaperone GrpE
MSEEEKKEVPPPAPEEPAPEDFKDKYFRALAEMENMRKRMGREKQELSRFGVDNTISQFLPALDNFENALTFADSATGEVKNWALGFKMILAQFKEVLHQAGVVIFHSEGKQFDPLYHEAVELEETDKVPDGTILQEFTRGYKSADRIIRPARVKVAKHPTTIQQEENHV